MIKKSSSFRDDDVKSSFLDNGIIILRNDYEKSSLKDDQISSFWDNREASFSKTIM